MKDNKKGLECRMLKEKHPASKEEVICPARIKSPPLVGSYLWEKDTS